MDPNQQQPPVSSGAPVPPGQQPQYQQPVPPQPGGPVAEDPGQTLGIVGLIVGVLVTPLVGLPLCIVGNNKSKQAGFPGNTIARVGIWVNVALLALFALAVLGFILMFALSSAHSA